MQIGLAPASTPVASCTIPGTPDAPQRPVPIPATPPPDWRRQSHAIAETAHGSVALQVDGSVGATLGYGRWIDAVEAATSTSELLGRAVSILDHDGRLYLRTLWAVPASGFGAPYRVGVLGERAIDFPTLDMRGIVQGERVLSRGDCLVSRVIV